MLPIYLAQQLKQAGLQWTPNARDFFALPDHDMDGQVFVINFMTVGVGMMGGQAVVTFHGAIETPIDYIQLTDAVWLPTEAQLRTLLEEKLVTEAQPAMRLSSTPDGYLCQIQYQSEAMDFDAFGVAEAYGKALLHVLKG